MNKASDILKAIKPINIPPANCQISRTTANAGVWNDPVAICTKVSVSKIAMGSLAADSTFSVAASLSLIGLDLVIIKTPAASVEDIIEEIVGDIQDEFDNEHEDILSVGNNMWLCEARVDLDNLNEALEAEFPAAEFDSLGGFVFDLFGKIPVKFEKVSWGDYDFVVQDMEGYRINLIKVIKRNEEQDDENKNAQ